MLEYAASCTERVHIKSTIGTLKGYKVSVKRYRREEKTKRAYTPPSACCIDWIKLWYAASRAAYRSVPLSLMFAMLMVSPPA